MDRLTRVGWDDTAAVVDSRGWGVGGGQSRCGDENESRRVEKKSGAGVCAVLHTSVCEKPSLRKMQAGPTMLCSMLQFFTRAPKGS